MNQLGLSRGLRAWSVTRAERRMLSLEPRAAARQGGGGPQQVHAPIGEALSVFIGVTSGFMRGNRGGPSGFMSPGRIQAEGIHASALEHSCRTAGPT